MTTIFLAAIYNAAVINKHKPRGKKFILKPQNRIRNNFQFYKLQIKIKADLVPNLSFLQLSNLWIRHFESLI